MNIFNKHFWKFVVGFFGIIILSLVSLIFFNYWSEYEEEAELRALIKEKPGINYAPSVK